MTKIDKNKQTPHFRTYSRFDLPQTLYGDRGRRDHWKRFYSFFDPKQFFLWGARKNSR